MELEHLYALKIYAKTMYLFCLKKRKIPVTSLSLTVLILKRTCRKIIWMYLKYIAYTCYYKHVLSLI